jgi:Bacterial protein of unknown function (DUF922)
MLRWTSYVAILLSIGSLDCAGIAADADAPRKYADGPITPADFRAAVPDPPPVKDGVKLRAMTHTEIRYSTRYRWDEAKAGKVAAWLTRFECSAQLDRDQCWNNAITDLRLLDHEQGHFDITEINARRAQKKFDQLIGDKALVGHGRDEKSAVADLNKQIQDQMAQIFDKERDEQIEYDKATNHGRDFAAQAKQRGLQHDQLKESDRKN